MRVDTTGAEGGRRGVAHCATRGDARGNCVSCGAPMPAITRPITVYPDVAPLEPEYQHGPLKPKLPPIKMLVE